MDFLRHFKHPPTLRALLALALAVLAYAGFGLLQAPAQDTVVAAPSTCADPGLSGTIDVDTTLSGDLFITGNVTVRDGATLTLTAGTHVTMCGPYELVLNNGALHAVGTPADPITFAGETPATAWRRIFFNGAGARLLPSTMQHVVLDGGGGSDPAADFGALYIYDAGVSSGVGPNLENVTIRNSGAYGAYVRVHHADATPPLLSGLTITNSARAPMLLWASAVGGLGSGNTFTGNAEQALEVRSGTVLGGGVSSDQTWRRQPVPLRMASEGGPLTVDGDTTPTLTLEAGSVFRMEPGFGFRIVEAHLVAEGTPTEPIVFERADPAQAWHRIAFIGSGTTIPTSTLRHVILNGGGGNDATAEDAALYLISAIGTQDYGVVADHVSILNSGAFGVYVHLTSSDATPMRFSNLNITGSARAPMRLDGATVSGLGADNLLTGNAADAIEVVTSGYGGPLDYDATWRPQNVPYRLLGLLTISGAQSPVLTIAPGTTLEMTATAGIKVGDGGLVIEGTPLVPITITRAPGVTSWGQILFEGNVQPVSRLAYVTLEYAGGATGAVESRADSLSLDHVTVRHATSAGLYSRGTFVQVKDSVFEQNAVGVRFEYSSGGVLRRNIIQNNGVGVEVLTNSGVCVDAMGNYWGAADGPGDGDGTLDACNLTTTNAGAGNAVTADVLYRPWLSGTPGTGALDASQITADDFWVVADGVQTTTLTVRARNAQGTPLAGKVIALETTRGSLQQPLLPTGADGTTTAVISSTEAGIALVTAFNTTDGQPLAALASLTFWQGLLDNAGLVPSDDVPYASPRLVIEGQPFEQGLPMAFRLPMQNSNPVPVEVQVVYHVSALSIGAAFTPVYTTSTTLDPGEAWDAPGTWVPPVTGHHCVRAEVTVILPDGEVQVFSPAEVVKKVGPFTVNLNFIPPDPCESLDPDKLIPNSGGLGGVRKHVKRGLVQGYLAKECLSTQLGFGPSGASTLGVAGISALRDYEVVLPPPAITMPQLEPDGEVSQAQADAANAVVDSAAELLALDVAIATARERAQQAGEADDANALSRQTTAFRDYQRARGAALQKLAARLDALLAVTQGAGEPDTPFTPADYAAYLLELQTVGYDAETIAFHQASGLSAGEIEGQQQREIALLQETPFFVTSFYEILTGLREAALTRGAQVQARYGLPTTQALLATQANGDDGLWLGTLTTEFVVANPFETQETIELLARPVELPLDWTYSLSPAAPTLGPGEATTVTLTIDVGYRRPEATLARLAVEGYVDDEPIGGILFEQAVPASRPAHAVFLPLAIRN